MTARQVSERWAALLAALAEIDPGFRDDLHPGAAAAAIDRLQNAMRVALPDELEALYRANNGAGRLGSEFDPPLALLGRSSR